MDVASPITTGRQKEDTDKITRACAEACGVDRKIVEKVCPASKEQEHRMDHHINTGQSYMMQMVLHNEGDLNHSFLLRVLSAMRVKNHILRTRLIRYDDQVYQVVLKDAIVFQQAGVDLHSFLAKNSRIRMDYGTPLFRYAFIQEPHGEAFFIWTVHCSAVDAWTLRLIFDDLQVACSDLAAYSRLPPRPFYGKYATWLASYAFEAGISFWLTRHTTFDKLTHRFPVLGLGGKSSVSTRKAKKLLHLPKVDDAEFSLPTMGHAAWALTIAMLLTPDYPTLVNEDISFISTSSARESSLPGIKHMMGPISARVPIRIRFFPDLSIENLMRDIKTGFLSMIGFEHCAMKALSNEADFQRTVKQAVFNWNLPDCDLSSKRIVCYDKQAAPTVLDFREDLSVPFAHDYGLMFEVYEHGEHITIRVNWDQDLVSVDLINRLIEDFGSFLSSIIRTRGVTVVELLSAHGFYGQMAGFEPQPAGLPSERLLDS